ncbi:MAG: 4Fe-4S dicluster domain-containing protein, partial [Thermoguttaceae bacterium]|nr:4Fe-4S dicluster domain-containing protein [Thermoguttaceae bacterium]
GGTIGSAQGTALARSFALTSRYPKLSSAFVEIKNLFDPNNIFNPGKIVTDEMRRIVKGQQPAAPSVPLYWSVPLRTRFVPTGQNSESTSRKPVLKDQLELQLKWDKDIVREPTYQCNGCGLCRIRTGETRMCPVFRTRTSEDASCRAKPNLLRGILDGKLSLESLTDDEMKRLADACISCHSCQAECPAQVDIPELAFRIKSAYNASHGMSLRDRIMANAGAVLAFSSFFNGPFNCVLSKRLPRWIIRKFLTIPAGIKLPALSKGGLFKNSGWRKKYARPTRRHEQRVALFLDLYANYFDDKLIEAAVRVLEHNNIEVVIPPRQKESGHEAFSFGDGDRAESLVRNNVNVFADLVRQRYTVVTLEPVSAVCLKKEYAYVRNDEEAVAVAENTVDLCDYLYRLHLDGKLQLDFNPVRCTVGYHAPCRTLALTGESVALATPAQELLHLVPGLNVNRIERGCCGLAGGIGLIGANHKMTLKLGMPLTLALRDSAIAVGSTECNSCKLQLEQRIDKPILHPVKILAYAYGLMPELGPLLAKLQ